MLGNAHEWVLDCANVYRPDPLVDPHGPAWGKGRMQRGGSWRSSAWYCRSTYRTACYPRRVSMSVGFRVVLLPDVPWQHKPWYR
jgi:formylglycine-generating enzyme required for sulfatase activity